MFCRIIICCTSLIISTIAVANESEVENQEDIKGLMYLEGGEITINSATALKEGVEDTATYFLFAMESFTKKPWIFGGGLSFIQYSDNKGFSQPVVDQNGQSSTASSNAGAVSIFGNLGVGATYWNAVSTDLLIGYEFTVESDRTISNCTDCATVDIDINMGAYINPRLRFHASNGFTIALAYRQYLTGDIENSVDLLLGWAFRK